MAVLYPSRVSLGSLSQTSRDSESGDLDGSIILNNTTNNLNYYSSNIGGWVIVQRGPGNGSSAALAGTSGQQIKTDFPSSTTGSGKTDYLGFIYNVSSSKWNFVAQVLGF